MHPMNIVGYISKHAIDLTLLQACKQLLIRLSSIVFEVIWNLFNMLMKNSPFCCVNCNS